MPHAPSHRRAHFPAYALALLTALLLAVAGNVQAGSRMNSPGWEAVGERDGIKTFVRHGTLSKLKTFKGITRIKIRDEYMIATVLNDYSSYPKWLYMFDPAQEIRRDDPLHRFMYLTADLPWPVRNRDMGVEVIVRQAITPTNETMLIDIRSKDDLVPPKDGYVRVKEISGQLQFKRVGNDEFEVTFEAYFDPAGRLPLWLVNVLANDIPHYTLSQLRRSLQGIDYKPEYIDYLELRGPTRKAGLPPARSYIYKNPPAEPITELALPQVNQAAPAAAAP